MSAQGLGEGIFHILLKTLILLDFSCGSGGSGSGVVTAVAHAVGGACSIHGLGGIFLAAGVAKKKKLFNKKALSFRIPLVTGIMTDYTIAQARNGTGRF